MTKSKQASSARQFKITVNYGYDVHSIIVNQADMDKIKNGEAVTVKGQGVDIEGDTEMDDWSFHCSRPNSLEVQCEDGHQVFDGDLKDTIINEI